ncbi:telomeric repeat binding factor a isoform X2 [Sander vitreus]
MVDNMAAKRIVNSYQTEDVESTVNRWIVDYYFYLGLELFKNEQYADFCGIRDILESVLVRPLESTDVMKTKIRILQFLSRINDGEKNDVSFEADHSVTPLESALSVLEDMSKECSIPQQDFEKVCISIKDMMVWMLINNNEFDKAKEVLNKRFPKPMVGKKAIFMSLIKKKSKMHQVEQINFSRFKKEMLAFCQSLCPLSVPFLHKAATHLIDERLKAQIDKEVEPDEQEKAGPSFTPPINIIPFGPCKHTIIQKARLEAAYKALAAGSDERTFAQLEEEVEEEVLCLRLSPSPEMGIDRDSEQDGLFQRDSGSPMEASPADQPPHTGADPQTQAGSLSKTPSVLRNRRLYTVARLVVEPDSQGSSQCTTALQEVETDVRTEEPPQSLAIPSRKGSQSPLTDNEVTIPVRKCPRRANKISSRASTCRVVPAELSTESDEDPPGSEENGEISAGKCPSQSNSSLSGNSTKSRESSSDSKEDPQESLAPCKTPVRKPRKQLASEPLSKDTDVCIADSLDSSPNLFPRPPVPQTSSTPHKDSAQDKGPSNSKWKRLFKEAKETKETWSDEESYVTSRKKTGSHNESTISNSGNKKRKWSESETKKLKEGVRRFGEGNWSKIMAYYSFEDRTNVNLKDRWRTLKKTNQV